MWYLKFDLKKKSPPVTVYLCIKMNLSLTLICTKKITKI